MSRKDIVQRAAPEPAERTQRDARRDVAPLPAGSASAVLALQRSAGNRAVANLLRSRALARDPQPAAAPVEGPIPHEPVQEVFDLETIEEETKTEIILAFGLFCDACDANVAAMKAAAKASAEAAALFIDIATGFLAPAFAGVMGATFVGRLTAKLAAKAVIPQPDEVIKELITNADLLKAGFTGAAKGVGDQIKRNSTQLFGEGPIDAFLDDMKTEFQRHAVTLVGKVHNMEPHTLIGVWAAYDPELANIHTYKATIQTLLAQMHAIETVGSDMAPMASPLVHIHRKLYRVEGTDRDRLVVLNDVASPFGQHRGFVTWVPAHLEEMALEEEKAEHGGAPAEITLDDIVGGAPAPPD